MNGERSTGSILSFRFLDCVPSVCLDMMNTSRLAAQCIRFYERPPRKRKMSERKQSDSGERERRRVGLERGEGGGGGRGRKGQGAATARADFITLFC